MHVIAAVPAVAQLTTGLLTTETTFLRQVGVTSRPTDGWIRRRRRRRRVFCSRRSRGRHYCWVDACKRTDGSRPR
jgi:hypothetical protein